MKTKFKEVTAVLGKKNAQGNVNRMNVLNL